MFQMRSLTRSLWASIVLIPSIVALSVMLAPSTGFAHSGGTDSNGGHNCNVGACAGTYHYHNGGSSNSGGSSYTPRITIPSYTYTPRITIPSYTYTPRSASCDWQFEDEGLQGLFCENTTSTLPRLSYSGASTPTLPHEYKSSLEQQAAQSFRDSMSADAVDVTVLPRQTVKSGLADSSTPSGSAGVQETQLVTFILFTVAVVFGLWKCKQIGDRK